MNHSCVEKPMESWKPEVHQVIITSFLIGTFIVLTLVGNMLVIAAFCLCKELRTITNYFLISLSVADLLTALLSMPIFMVSRISRGNWFPGGAVFYDVWRSMDVICGTASIWNLCLVSLDRYLAVTSPLKHLVILTTGRAKAVIVLVWAISLGLSGLLHMTWSHKSILIIAVSFFLPLIIIIFSYAKIYQVTTRSCDLRRNGGTQLKRDVRSAKQMVLVISVFILCWVGFFVLTLILSTNKSMRSSVNPEVIDVVKSLTYLNSCINPLLYTVVSRKFKKAITDILHGQRPNLACKRHSTLKRLAGKRTNIGSAFGSFEFSGKSTSFRHQIPFQRGSPSPQMARIVVRETTV
ncbi:alpha-1D adrenergic receptor-like [Acropora palmata]|uniref:alpha-1D adrenergic receptor-like n=1 Tax=Acropora palmata TaxID=6131 RepID=UPI003DA0BE71